VLAGIAEKKIIDDELKGALGSGLTEFAAVQGTSPPPRVRVNALPGQSV
jgi:hypothetical protein